MRRWLPIPLLAFLAGCFPLEIDVNASGEMLIVRQEGFFVYNPATKKVNAITGLGPDSAEWARFAPDGKSILAVTRSAADNQYHFHLITLADGATKEIYKTESCNYARFSPDGKSIAVSRGSSRKTKKVFDGKETDTSQSVCELAVIDVATGDARRMREATILPMFRWFADSKRLLAVVAEGQNEKSGRYRGHLCEVDAATGKMTKIVSVLTADKDFVMDLSPDNRKALLVVEGVDKLGKTPHDDGNWGFGASNVIEVDLAAKTFRTFVPPSPFAVYSPDGRHVLTAEKDKKTVVVTDAAGKNPRTIAEDGWSGDSFTLLSQSTITPTLFGWRDNDTVFYFAQRKVYGSTRDAPWLKLARLKDGSSEFVQPYLDRAVVQAEATIRNPKTGDFSRTFAIPGDDDQPLFPPPPPPPVNPPKK